MSLDPTPDLHHSAPVTDVRSPDESARIRQAIADVSHMVRRSGQLDTEHVSSACRQVARAVQLRGDASVVALRDRLRLPDLDPLVITWDPLTMLGRSQDEPEWTQWLTALLQLPGAGELVWRALISVVDGAARDLGVTAPDRLALAAHPGADRIVAEEWTQEGRRADLVIDHPEVLMLVENKLWEDWHDDGDKRQSDWLSEHATRRAGSRPVLLVFLAAYRVEDRPTVQREGWTFVTWEELAIALRRQLSYSVPVGLTDARALMDFVPVMLTIGSVEREILGLRPPHVDPRDDSWKDLEQMTRLVDHLEASHAEIDINR